MSSVRKSKQIAVCGLSAALITAVMYVSSFLYIFTYVAPMFMGLVILVICEYYSRRAAFGVYVSVSVLSFILVSDKELSLSFILFFGYYPILRYSLQKIKNKFARFVLKFLIFNASLTATELLSFYVFGIEIFDNAKLSAAVIIIFAAAFNLVFLLYEILIPQFIIYYNRKLKPKLKKFLK